MHSHLFFCPLLDNLYIVIYVGMSIFCRRELLIFANEVSWQRISFVLELWFGTTWKVCLLLIFVQLYTIQMFSPQVRVTSMAVDGINITPVSSGSCSSSSPWNSNPGSLLVNMKWWFDAYSLSLVMSADLSMRFWKNTIIMKVCRIFLSCSLWEFEFTWPLLLIVCLAM